ncbi:MAG: prepilin-type N-terminal cleavage/methylation domain-containing protein [Thermoflexaceae bacterium]|nr:prepilin-type N-terminal cleavage/methylation domain-containing protein [Thermoflexaceae bacterium]
MKKQLKNDNRGVSVVEMTVVIAIMAVMITVALSVVSYILKGDIKKATKTVYSEISSNHTQSMVKPGKWIFKVDSSSGNIMLQSIREEYSYEDNSGATITVPAVEFSRETLSERVNSIEVRVYDAEGSSVEFCGSSEWVPLTSIRFKKNTGAVDKINEQPLPNTSGYAHIKVSILGNERLLILYFLTGEIQQVQN